MTVSRLENALSYHVRCLLPQLLSHERSHKLAYVFSLVSAISSGFIALITLYAQPWQSHLKYNAWQINLIVSVANLGVYLVPPLLGIFADAHGPILLSSLATVGFVPSYSILSYLFNHPEIDTITSFHWSIGCFCLIGASTSALFFSSLLTCAKLYPETKLLSISLPTTCFGLSSFLVSQLLQLDWFWYTNRQYLDLGRVFGTFAGIYASVGALAWIATARVSMMQFKQNDAEDDEDDENEPLLSSHLSIPPNQRSFFKDIAGYLFALSLMLALGPLEMMTADIGVVANLVFPHFPTLSSELVSVYAFYSTITRLLTGVVTDWFTRKNWSPKWILLGFLSTGLLLQLGLWWLVVTPSVGRIHALGMSSLLGIVYGGSFTIVPTVVMIVWGEQLFGTAYGSMMVAPAIGTLSTCMAFAKVYDSNCAVGQNGSYCISPVFKMTSLQFLCSIFFICCLFRIWSKRKVNI
ncbi:hypothetical protein ZYGR_0H01400 [Zygosaccharomyces rouxii]|uniref:Probable transporter MCH1 n=2 Tax=Zygosaccharomyces rouxii TaxID=4956 RepID=C5DRC0_ZYGRC|nr:uncharacterized protein ZYRO0B07260g [Zygosaccharomyces rouxii]KAH9200127.1 major facilitator superfamily domain-containing protein [Zygosaccharomyces rouxii]GAV47299.1 hypothetical protein ZYGR_0H01400 [Zygosaccharomyces rouxii]CAR26331.1 ZYRO0B07260p [Zygosaccharomyces rouxii]